MAQDSSAQAAREIWPCVSTPSADSSGRPFSQPAKWSKPDEPLLVSPVLRLQKIHKKARVNLRLPPTPTRKWIQTTLTQGANLIPRASLTMNQRDGLGPVSRHFFKRKRGITNIPAKVSPRKRQKTGQAVTKRGARLSKLPTMPLDILFEVLSSFQLAPPTLDRLYQIFSYLSPRDLLRIALVNKVFRSNLLDRTNESIWRNARKSISAPAPPRRFSEHKWLRLLCGEPRCQVSD